MPSVIDKLSQYPLSLMTKVVLLCGGILLPIACFAMTALGASFGGEWQSGNLHDKYGYLLSTPAVIPFYPFLLYAIVCLSLLLWDETWARRFWVRFGIHSGCVVSLPFGVLLVIAVAEIPRVGFRLLATTAIWTAAAFVSGIVVWAMLRWGLPLAGWCIRRILANAPRSRILRWQWLVFGGVSAFALIALLSALLGVLEDVMEGVVGIFGLAILGSLACAPFWAFLVYGFLAFRVYWAYPDLRRFRLVQILALLTWIAAYLGAWRQSVRLSLEQYALLPTEPPDQCYVCSTAARGHTRWVGSRLVRRSGGGICAVNDQMRYLKAAELAIRVSSPALHRALRGKYDRFGPRLAAGLNHVLVADLAYCLLKPVEWIVRGVLATLLPGFGGLARHLYDSSSAEDA